MRNEDTTVIPFDWDALTSVDFGLNYHQERLRTEVWSLTLASGRDIRLDAIHQQDTYRGVLCGAGFRHVAERSVRNAMRKSREVFGWDGDRPIHVVAPRLLRYRSNVARPSEPPNICDFAQLPPVCTMAEFRSESPARDPEQAYSSLVVVWFQDAYGVPDDEHILDGLRQVPWDGLAWDWNY